MRRVAFGLAALAALLGVLLNGAWGVVGLVAGGFIVLAARLLRAPWPGAALAAAFAPLLASGPTIVPVALVLGLVVAGLRFREPRVLLLGGLAAFLPVAGAPLAAAAGGAAYLALAPWPWALLGAAVALLPAIVAPLPGAAAGFLAIGAGLVARLLAAQPANLSIARLQARIGLLGLPLPALLSFGLAALGIGPRLWADLLPALAAALLVGVLLLAVQVGLALFHLAEDAPPGPWTALAWSGLAGTAGLVLDLGVRAAWPLLPPLALLAAASAAVAFAWAGAKVTRDSPGGGHLPYAVPPS